MTLGKLAPRGLLSGAGGDRLGLIIGAGGDRLGLGGTLISGLAVSEGTLRLNGACEPRALERETSCVGADAERWVLRSVADVMNVFGSWTTISALTFRLVGCSTHILVCYWRWHANPFLHRAFAKHTTDDCFEIAVLGLFG